ncbi:mucin-5AC-like [Scylla paramamosain]|uniref:mucin-5AC-like n=1 Tax=Scylla paramamosain TaxID=85552 RepID=UPI003082965F
MLLSTCMVVVVMAVTTAQAEAAAAATSAAESVMERQMESQAVEARGNPGGTPSVNAKRLTRRRRSLDFDGWFPMDVSNPMADDPTVAYQPPPLERVHFSNEPMKEKPLYPVRPENPTVFVVRSEKQKPEYHSVYGTENIEYYHINPQSNIVRAFRSPSFTIGEATLVPEQTEATTTSSTTSTTTSTTTDSTAKAVEESSSVPETNLEIPQKEEGFSDRSDVFYEDTELSDGEASPDEKPGCETETESDLEGAFSETRTSVILPPELFYLLRERSKKLQERMIAQLPQQTPAPPPARRRFDNTATIRTGPALHELLGNLPRESQIEESPYLGSATDSAGVRKIPPPNFRYASLRTSASRQSPVTSRTRVRGSSTRKPASSGRPWYLIDTRSSDSSRRREPSIASYIVPDTLSGDSKVNYKPNGPVSYVNKQITTITDLIDNPHLNDHMNSYKPTLTANSLSELLQIFRYTQVTNGPGGSSTEEPVTVREFRYTRPTEETPTTEILPTNYRYTPSPSKFSDPTTEPGITERPPAVYSDAVADTNSLDGYLFSDSEANPEYARPQVRQNAVVKEDKDADREKGAARGTSKVKINSNLVQRATATSTPAPRELRVIRPGPAPSSKITTVSPQYVIYQGHSKVKVFGVNSAEDNGWSKFDIRDFILASTPSSSSTTTTPAPRPSSTPSLPTATTTFAPTSPSPSPLPSTNATLPSTSSSPVEQSTSLPITDTTPLDTTEATLPSGVGEEYEYYYADGDYGVTDLAFGDYQTEDFGQHLIYVSGQLPPPPGVVHLAHPPPLTPTEERQGSTDHSMKDPLEGSFPQALSPATALTQAELLDIFANQQPEDSQFSHPTWPATEAATDQPAEDDAAENNGGA